MIQSNVVLHNLTDGLMIITVNRPEKLNALNNEVLSEIEKAIDLVNSHSEIRGAIITGAGEKAFVAGADIGEFLEVPNELGIELSKKGQSIFSKIEESKKPIIAAVNGYALGGGCELALSCHFRIASEQAKFGQPEINLGIIPGYGGTQRLPRLIGKGRAMEMMMTGELMNAEEAYRVGLINMICKPDELLQTAEIKMRAIVSKPKFALEQLIKSTNASDRDQGIGYQTEADSFGKCFSSDEKTEGVSAFLEKRKPNFK